MSTVLVTGATGFIGRHVCQELEARGFEVRGATRTSDHDLKVPAVNVGDIGRDTDWRVALAGCEAVVHLAAHVHAKRALSGETPGAFMRVNTDGSEQLARQAARAGVRRLIFVSSVKVNGERTADRGFVESDPPAPLDAYGASKAHAEERLKAVASETGMEIVILRPPLVYGPGVGANFLKLLRAVDAGVPLPFASVNNRRSLIYVGNLAYALGVCLMHPDAANRTFFVSDDLDVSTPQLVREMAAALGKRPRLLPCAPGVLRVAGLWPGLREQLDRLTGSLQVDVSSIKTALGWRPPYTLQQGLARTAAWYRGRSGQ